MSFLKTVSKLWRQRRLRNLPKQVVVITWFGYVRRCDDSYRRNDGYIGGMPPADSQISSNFPFYCFLDFFTFRFNDVAFSFGYLAVWVCLTVHKARLPKLNVISAVLTSFHLQQYFLRFLLTSIFILFTFFLTISTQKSRHFSSSLFSVASSLSFFKVLIKDLIWIK